jgi:hypothetical protein
MMQIIECTALAAAALADRSTPPAGQADLAAASTPSVSWDGTYWGTAKVIALGSGWLAGVFGGIDDDAPS